ncbi:Holliday junction ATP-dependent DNA helicase RuvA [Legionella busanensis]|uniref:Holliday junction branch migration complex subunit RuvA n=1 Tax=Legionella busanensis TaxID=190655 RepID=A0A378JLR1_9GAMM|nr:Holliday junction branch migration protein RuvA [Legionella busanensis]STX51628.1 Holliday junction ATP-dependent DNA helicase RuvA [Legionella busanensis]
MIGWLQGKIIDKQQPGKLVINVQGVGYDVETSLQTFFKLDGGDDIVSLHIHTVVREDAFLLYGFLDKLERSVFRALIKINGVGPRVAIGILSSVTPLELIQSISQNNTNFLTKLPGIGKKTAERLIIEMKDIVNQLAQNEVLAMPDQGMLGNHQEQHEAICALEALGYKFQEATRVVKKLDDGKKTCEQLIREALRQLATHSV